MTDGVTKKVSKSRLLDFGLSAKVYILANPYVVMLKRYDEGCSDTSEIL